MNAHIPQSYEATAELQEIAAVPMQIIRPRDGTPLIAVVQDALAGAYLATQPGNLFTRREFMNLMMKNSKFQELPKPREGQRYTGQQIIGSLFAPINVNMKNSSYDKDKRDLNIVKIVEGEFLQGVLDKGIFNKSGKGIIHTTYNDYGPADTVALLDGLQNVVEAYLILKGFSVGISDLIADEDTKQQMEETIAQKKKEVDEMLLQLHMDLFTNNSGKSNQEEVEARAFGILNKAMTGSGDIGLKGLSNHNRLMAMIRSGSKGDAVNVSQMIACVGQTALEGKRIPYGFTDRTLPHYKMYDDGAEARGFVEGSFVRGLTPQEMFFHAMSGREGLIDTAVKSVTGDTPIVILENEKAKRVRIGDWIDAQLEKQSEQVEHYDDKNLEVLNLDNSVFIPTTDEDGKVTWGKITAITRHDPGDRLYEIKTLAGKSVIVTESKSLLIWDKTSEKFLQKYTTDVSVGDCVPVTMTLTESPIVTTKISLEQYLPKESYIYGTEFEKAKNLMNKTMAGRDKIPNGWWEQNNGKEFVLPYPSKARFQRTQVRSNTDNIKPGCIYPYHATREHARITDTFDLNNKNGIFIGLFLAEGNVDVKSGYVQITNNDTNIRQFVKDWFEDMRIEYQECIKTNHIGGTSSCVRGFSTILAKFFDALVGHGAENKRVPNEALTAPEEFIVGLLNGYISGDGTVSKNSVEVGSASSELIDGISMLCTRIGVFGKVFRTQSENNNLGTITILPSYRLSIRAQWCTQFCSKVSFIDEAKEAKRLVLKNSEKHRNFPVQNDCVLDEIIEINIIGVEKYPKMYDLTVPSTLNFGLANGLHVVDTAETGYTQRQLIKAMEELTTQHDGTVRDATGAILQFYYGEDGINSTKIEEIDIPLDKLKVDEIRATFGLQGVDLTSVLEDGVDRGDDKELLEEYVNDVLKDRKMLVEGVYQSAYSRKLFVPLNIERILTNIKIKFNLQPTGRTTLTPTYILESIQKLIERTQPFNKVWIAALRYHLAPHTILANRFTQDAWNTLIEGIVVKNWKAWAVPGELVGIVAAQSIGEPATQMTLNSVDWDTEIVIAKNGKIITPQIGEFIDDYYMNCSDDTKVQYLENGRIYIELNDGNDWKAVSCDEDGNMKWTKLEAITRHPVVNEDGTNTILQVEMESGRIVKATKGKSFLTLVDGKIVGTNGSDLKVGDELPIANHLAIEGIGYIKELSLREFLPPSEYLYGTEVKTALETMRACDERGERHWFQQNQGKIFTVPYGRSDAFRDAFAKGHNSNDIRPGCVYNKHMKLDVSQIPETIPLTKEFGFFAGAYLAEGMSNKTQICITNNDAIYLAKVKDLMDTWKVGVHTVCEEREAKTTGIKGITTSMIIHSTILAKVMSNQFGRVSYMKTLPDWVLQATDDFLKGLVDGYICGDGTISKCGGSVSATSVSKKLLVKLGAVFARFGIFTTMSSYMPKLGKFKSVSRNYTLSIPVKYSNVFHETFELSLEYKQHILDALFLTRKDEVIACKREQIRDMVWDKIKSISEVVPMKEGWVYDLTVFETRNFTCATMMAQKDTFHQAGVASKSAMTRGVPRLKELLKVTHNPKATSLAITLIPAFRNDKDRVREVTQDLELTLLRDIVLKAGIYYDPKDAETVIEEDKELITFFEAFEMRQNADDDAPTAAVGDDKEVKSRWLIRLEFDREKMFNKNITMDDVNFVITDSLGFTDQRIRTVYSDYNSHKLIMRIRVQPSDSLYGDDLASIKKFQNKLLNNTVIRGVPGIKSVNWRKDKSQLEEVNGVYTPVEKYILDTDGANFLAVMNHPAVDGNKLYSTNVHDIYEQLGIEATRFILYAEISSLFGEADINYRHLGLLMDVMTRNGRLMSVDRYGINKNDSGPLAKACFEETEKILLKAALFGEMDPVTGVSANIMTGQTIRAGTAFSQVLLDEAALPRLMEGLTALPEDDEEEDEVPDQGAINAELYSEENDMCAQTQLQMNMTLPVATADIEEDDIEIIVS